MRRARAALILVLLALGAIRLIAVAVHDPIAGYANQYDMARSSACLGLWVATAPPGSDAATQAAPIAHYRYGGPRGAACYPSTDVALAALAIALDYAFADVDREHDFDLRQLGVLKALLLIGFALALDRGLRLHDGARAAHAAVFGLVIADPFNTLYLNTLYTEFGALAGAYLALGALLALSLQARPRNAMLVAFLMGLLALGASRVQHLALAPALALVALLLFRARAWPLRTLMLGAACVIAAALALAASIQTTQGSVAAANRIDTVFDAILPASAAPRAFATRLGLPAPCAELEHTTWYRQRGHDVLAECPEIMRVSRLRMAAELLREPRVPAVMFGKSLALGSAWRMTYLGEIGDAHHARLVARPVDVYASVADLLAPRGFAFQACLWLAPLLGGALALIALIAATVRKRPVDAPLVVLAASGAVCALTLASALLGDGYNELARHLHLAQNAVLVAWLALLCGIWRGARARVRDAGQSSPPGWVTPTALLACGIALLGAPFALARLPLAYGVLDAPATDGAHPVPLALSGWALDPFGVAAVEARVGDGPGVPLVLRADDLLSRLLPFARGKAIVRFAGVMAKPPESAHVLTIVARNTRGVETEIDLRRVRSGPSAQVLRGTAATRVESLVAESARAK